MNDQPNEKEIVLLRKLTGLTSSRKLAWECKRLDGDWSTHYGYEARLSAGEHVTLKVESNRDDPTEACRLTLQIKALDGSTIWQVRSEEFSAAHALKEPFDALRSAVAASLPKGFLTALKLVEAEEAKS